MGLAPSLADPGADAPTGGGWTVGRIITVVAVLAMVGFWAWIFAGGPDKANPDYLTDRTFVALGPGPLRRRRTTGSTPCQPARDATTAVERADVIDQATGDIADAGRRPRGEGADSRATMPRAWQGWIHDWRDLDRRPAELHRRRWRADPRAQFLVSTNKAGDSVDTPIKNFADINDIPECDPPLDVG